MSKEERIKLASILSHSQRLQTAYKLKEEFREIFETSSSVEEGKEHLLRSLRKARTV